MSLRIVTFSVVFLFAFLLYTCTRNPFSNDKISESTHLLIRGSVELSDGAQPDDVVIWLEGLNASGRSDASGEYALQILPPPLQPGGGLNGEYKLYFFLGNYLLRFTEVNLINGSFVFGEGGIDAEGRVRKVTLQKLLDISTSVQPTLIKKYSREALAIKVNLVPRANSVSVESYKESDAVFASGLVRNLRWTEGEPVHAFSSGQLQIDEVSSPTEWFMYCSLETSGLDNGAYEFIPFIKVVQEEVPPELLSAIGADNQGVHADFLKIPYKRENGYFEITTRIINGSIVLSDNVKANNVYVWFDGLNSATYTDNYGNFLFSLPEPSSQPGGGLQGQYKLYYYLGNYTLEHSLITIDNGHFVYGEADLSQDGTVLSSAGQYRITLKKLIDITTTVMPSQLISGADTALVVKMTLTPAEPVQVSYLKSGETHFSGAFLHNIVYPVQLSRRLSGGGAAVTETLHSATELLMEYPHADSLEAGDYKIIPYIFIAQDNLPAELLLSFGDYAREFHWHYLSIPFKRENGYLEVTPPGGY